MNIWTRLHQLNKVASENSSGRNLWHRAGQDFYGNLTLAKFRHEYKFLCNEADMTILQARLKGMLKLDSHVGEKGCYEIRSIYFDDIYDTCYHKNAAGTDPRAKYRIRCYDASDKRIVLEKKIKMRGKTHKKSYPLTREMYDVIMAGNYADLFREVTQDEAFEKQNIPDMSADGGACVVVHMQSRKTNQMNVLQEFLLLGMTRGMKPKVMVVYERIPFVEKAGNVRVTLDRNIASSTDYGNFFQKNLAKQPVLQKGRHLLEVKYDEFLPAYIKENLESGRLRQTTFSKYYICRNERMRR